MNLIWENVKKRWMLLAVLAAALCMYAALFYSETMARGAVSKSELAYLLLYGLLAVLVLVVPQRIVSERLLPLLDKLIDHRYTVTGILFLLLVAFQISGSSMNCLDAYFGESGENVSKVIAGTPRTIRSDEWFVNTEYHFAQVNSEEPFSVINKNIGEDGQNMLLACNSPVKHITLIGKPQTWGYLLLGASRGLSWFWWFRLFALLLGAYELAYILTGKNRLLSVFGMVLLGFSPVMMWWQSTTLVDLMVAGEWLFVSFYYLVFSENLKKRLGMTVLLVMSAVAYVVSLYPAMQVPFGYLLLILTAYYLVHNRKEIWWDKWTTLLFLAALAVIGLTVGLFVKDSYADILKVLNTAYPGKRELVTGNVSLLTLFYYVFAPLLPYREITFANNCEVSAYLVFLPALLILLVRYFGQKKTEKKNRTLLILLGVYVLFLFSMCVLVYPQAVLKATLFSFTTVKKNLQIAGIALNYMLLLMLGEKQQEEKTLRMPLQAAVTGVTFVFYLYLAVRLGGRDYVGMAVLIGAATVFALIELIVLAGRRELLLASLCVTLGLSSLCVNPVIYGTASMTDSGLIQEIKALDGKKSGSWLILGTMVQQNVMAANGIHVLNATQYEPNLDYWSRFDASGEYEEAYNRYAHVVVNLTDQKTAFEVLSGDLIQVSINVKDLDRSGADYLASAKKLDKYVKKGILNEEAYCEASRMYLYSVNR